MTRSETTNEYPYYSIVTFGCPTMGRYGCYYRSLDRAIADAKSLGGGSLTNVRVVGCETRQQAIDACISGSHPVLWQS